MGCEGMSAMILKGPVHYVIDALVNGDPETRAGFLAALKALQPPDEDHTKAYLEILTSHAPQLAHFNAYEGASPVNLLAYLLKTWYNPKEMDPKTALGREKEFKGFWAIEYHPIEPVIRQGLITAIELAIEKSLPLDSYWIAAGDRVETLVICNPQQITRILMTPPSPPPEKPENLMNFADIRVIKSGEKAPHEMLVPQNHRGRIITTKLNVMQPRGLC